MFDSGPFLLVDGWLRLFWSVGRASVSGNSHGGRAGGSETLVNALMLVGFCGN